MIRQAISCDICGAEKRQTNHWFVAYTQGGELRVAPWNSNGRMRAGAKHLCGQTCLHKLMDEFIARAMSNRAGSAPEPVEASHPGAATDGSLTCSAVYTQAAPRSLHVLPSTAAPVTPTRPLDQPRPPLPVPVIEGPPEYGSHRRRAEAWERERERCSSLAAHRKAL